MLSLGTPLTMITDRLKVHQKLITFFRQPWAGNFNILKETSIGRLNKGLDEANEKGWAVVDMKKDWDKIYP